MPTRAKVALAFIWTVPSRETPAPDKISSKHRVITGLREQTGKRACSVARHGLRTFLEQKEMSKCMLA